MADLKPTIHPLSTSYLIKVPYNKPINIINEKINAPICIYNYLN